MGRVSGRACTVTGAAQGIGRAIGEALLDEGAPVCFADIDGDKVAEVAARNGLRVNDPAAATSVKVDVTDRAQVRAMIAHTAGTFGRLDAKFNSADVTGTTTFLAARDSDDMTGQIVMIDGGMTLV